MKTTIWILRGSSLALVFVLGGCGGGGGGGGDVNSPPPADHGECRLAHAAAQRDLHQCNGRFYGPGATEPGGTFTASDGGGFASGAFVGGRVSAVQPDIALAALTHQTELTATTVSASPSLEDVNAVFYDPAINGYRVNFRDRYLAVAPTYTTLLGDAARDEASSNASADVYRTTVNGLGMTATVNRPLAGNPGLALTYSSFATIRAPQAASPQNTDPRNGRYGINYGIATSKQQMPLSGLLSPMASRSATMGRSNAHFMVQPRRKWTEASTSSNMIWPTHGPN